MQCNMIVPRLSEFRKAARDLVRPEEVAHLIQRPLKAIEEVGGWIAAERRSGRLAFIADAADGYDHWCSPAAVIAKGGGDCDCFSILACSLARAGGIEAWIVLGTRDRVFGPPEPHAWVEGVDASGPWWLEATTGRVWRSHPEGYEAVALLKEALQ